MSFKYKPCIFHVQPNGGSQTEIPAHQQAYHKVSTIAPTRDFRNLRFHLLSHDRMNSGLNLKIEELNTQLSCLYVENLRLRTLNVSLSVQLKQERDKSRKIISEAETAVRCNFLHDSLALTGRC